MPKTGKQTDGGPRGRGHHNATLRPTLADIGPAARPGATPPAGWSVASPEPFGLRGALRVYEWWWGPASGPAAYRLGCWVEIGKRGWRLYRRGRGKAFPEVASAGRESLGWDSAALSAWSTAEMARVESARHGPPGGG